MTIIGRWLSPEDPQPPDKAQPAAAPAAPATTPPSGGDPKPKQPPLTEIIREIADKGPNPSVAVLHQLCESWIRHDIVSEKNLRTALTSLVSKTQDKFIGHLLVDACVIIEDEVLYSMSKICRIPCYNISQYEINPAALALVNRTQAYAHEILPIDVLGRILTIAVTNPFMKLPFLAEKKLDVKKILCSRTEMNAALEIYYPEEVVPVAPAPAYQPLPSPPSLAPVPGPSAPPAASVKLPSLDAVFETWSHAANGTQPVLARRLIAEEVEFYIRQVSV